MTSKNIAKKTSIAIALSLVIGSNAFAETITITDNPLKDKPIIGKAEKLRPHLENKTPGQKKDVNISNIDLIIGSAEKSVSFDGSTKNYTTNKIYGADAESLSLDENSIFSASASGNKVTINNLKSNSGDNTTVYKIVGGHSLSNIKSNADNNTVIINSATLNNGTTKDNTIAGGFSQLVLLENIANATVSASSNTVTINDIGSAKYVYGGHVDTYAYTNNSNKAFVSKADNNTVTIKKGTFNTIAGGMYQSIQVDQVSFPATVLNNGTISTSNNTLNLSNVTANEVMGGYTLIKGKKNNDNNTIIANNNTINIDDSNINFIWGGAIRLKNESVSKLVNNLDESVSTFANNSTETFNNTINIRNTNGKTQLINTTIVGGNAGAKGNTLNIFNYQGMIKQINNFANVNFNYTSAFLSPKTRSSSDYLIHIKEGTNNFKDSKTAIQFILEQGADLSLFAGKKLLQNVPTTDLKEIKLTNGVTEYVVTPTENQNSWGDIVLDQEEIKKNQKGTAATKLLTTPLVANAMLLSQGTDMLLAQKFDQGVFAYIGGGTSSFDDKKTSLDLDVDGINLAIGYNHNISFANSALDIAGFVEYGNGSYDSKYEGNKASGDNSYIGAGILAKYKMNLGLFFNASLRAGQADGEIETASVTGFEKAQDNRSSYFAGHVGLGYDLNLSQNMILSPYARYQYINIGSDKLTVNTQDLDLKSFTSNKTAIGTNLLTKLNDNLSFKAGLAWEHEFDGEGKSTYSKIDLEKADFAGDAALVEAALSFQPTSNFILDVGAQARFGDYQGVSGQATAKYTF